MSTHWHARRCSSLVEDNDCDKRQKRNVDAHMHDYDSGSHNEVNRVWSRLPPREPPPRRYARRALLLRTTRPCFPSTSSGGDDYTTDEVMLRGSLLRPWLPDDGTKAKVAARRTCCSAASPSGVGTKWDSIDGGQEHKASPVTISASKDEFWLLCSLLTGVTALVAGPRSISASATSAAAASCASRTTDDHRNGKANTAAAETSEKPAIIHSEALKLPDLLLRAPMM